MPKVLSHNQFGLLLALLTTPLAGPMAAQATDLPTWIHPDPAARTVLLDLTVTHPPGAPSAVISGEHDGEPAGESRQRESPDSLVTPGWITAG